MEPVQIKTSLITYLDPMGGGVPIHIAVTFNEVLSYEVIYWIHPSNTRYLEVPNEFLELFDIVRIEDFPFLNELMDDIDTILPPQEEIFNELLNKTQDENTENLTD